MPPALNPRTLKTQDESAGRGSIAWVTVLLLGDERTIAQRAGNILAAAGFQCELCDDQPALFAALKLRGADIVVASLREITTVGLDLVRKVSELRPDAAVIVLAREPDADAIALAIRAGAFDCIPSPPAERELTAAVMRAIEINRLRIENVRLRQQLDLASTAAAFIAESAAAKRLVAVVRKVAPSRSTVLIEGETGTGKELVARMLHHWSSRADAPFVAINCKAFADGLVASELFGHERGSFTGAIAAHVGYFERASGGTLFLDEIAEAGADFQAKLLRVLEDGEVMRVGATRPRKVDVRIITASNRGLREEVAAERFRADLYFRLNVIPIRIAPLRERPDDIIPLARHFLAFHRAEAGRPLSLAPDAEAALIAHQWPGNVRELENVIERAVVMSESERLGADSLALDIGTGAETGASAVAPQTKGEPTLQDCLDSETARRIRAALATSHGNRAMAANRLGVDRTTLYRLMKRLGI